ncbi:unnamed protein product [Brugia timori]|nr:unnamed protein product [Brugia timori]
MPETRGKKLPDRMPDEELEQEELTSRKPAVCATTNLSPLKNIHTIKLNASY